MSKKSFHLRRFQLVISSFQTTVIIFSAELMILPNPIFLSICMYLLIPQFYLFTCLKTRHVLNYVPFWKDQMRNSITATSIMYKSSNDVGGVMIKIQLWLKRECWPLLQFSLMKKLICQSCSFLNCHCYPVKCKCNCISDPWIQAWQKCPVLQTSCMSWWVVTCSQNIPEGTASLLENGMLLGKREVSTFVAALCGPRLVLQWWKWSCLDSWHPGLLHGVSWAFCHSQALHQQHWLNRTLQSMTVRDKSRSKGTWYRLQGWSHTLHAKLLMEDEYMQPAWNICQDYK